MKSVQNNPQRFDGKALDYFMEKCSNPRLLELGFGNGQPLGQKFIEKKFEYEGNLFTIQVFNSLLDKFNLPIN